ncbi:MAG: antibiotic biosynthesis monooxygenase [Vulcanimicrobiaceae bacterium]
MIARMWHGRMKREDRAAYATYAHEHGIADYKRTPGDSGAYLLLRDEGDITHVITLSFWDSLGSIAAFAGVNHERARSYPADERYLVEFEPTVQHFEATEGLD